METIKNFKGQPEILVDKINELVDFVNGLSKWSISPVEKVQKCQIDDLVNYLQKENEKLRKVRTYSDVIHEGISALIETFSNESDFDIDFLTKLRKYQGRCNPS
jgi:hypothetical protein